MALTDFLLARIAEDEALAHGVVLDTGDGLLLVDEPVTIGGHQIVASASRVLAECEAKRRIVDLHQAADVDYGLESCFSCGARDGWHDLPFPCPTLKALAAVYADHPDYRDEWRP